MLPTLMTADEAEAHLSVTRANISKWLKAGDLHVAGSYHPARGKVVALYPSDLLVKLAEQSNHLRAA